MMRAGAVAGGHAALAAEALFGSWRSVPPPLRLSPEELASVEPLLARGGAAGLASRRVAGSPLAATPAGTRLQQTYHLQILQHAMLEREVASVVALLRARGVEPLVVKGWAAARLYPERGLRPPGDIDLLVPREAVAGAAAALRERPPGQAPVDLQAALRPPHDRPLSVLWAGSGAVMLHGVSVRVPAIEDHLRLLCVHMLAHGAWRPIWLCDVAAALEAGRAEFDWDRFLAGDRFVSEYAICGVGLAARLLGASLDGAPARVAERALALPRWLAPAVLRAWETGRPGHFQGVAPGAARRAVRDPAWLVAELRSRWRGPIQATLELRAPMNNLPRLPLQLVATLRRTPAFVRDLRGASLAATPHAT